jgi:hypothetical protein
MPDNLKAMLTKVLKNAGQTKYHFGYNAAKRKDNKADGELKVSGVKKVEKAKVVSVCAEEDYHFGRCWSSADGSTVYFKGEGRALTPALIVKMQKVARKLTNNPKLDFAFPDDREEARAAKLAEPAPGQTDDEDEDDESESDEAPDTTTIPPAPPLDEKNEVPKAPPLPPPVTGQVAQKDILAELRKMAGELATARAWPDQYGAQVNEQLERVNGLVKLSQFPEAEKALAVLKDRVAEALAAPAAGKDDLAGQFIAGLKALKQDYDRIKADNKAVPGDVALMMSEAATCGRSADFGRGMELITLLKPQIARLLQAPAGDGADKPTVKPSDTPVPDFLKNEAEFAKVEAEFVKKWQSAVGEWQKAVAATDPLITKLQRAMKKSGFAEVRKAADAGLNGFTGNFKVPLTAVIANIAAASGPARMKEVAKAYAVVAGFRKHLQGNELVEVLEGDHGFEGAPQPLGVRPLLLGGLGKLEEAFQAAGGSRQ